MQTGSSTNSNPQHMAHTLCKLAAAHEAVPSVMVTAAGTRELAGTLDIIIGISCRRTAAGSHDFGIKGGLQSEIWKKTISVIPTGANGNIGNTGLGEGWKVGCGCHSDSSGTCGVAGLGERCRLAGNTSRSPSTTYVLSNCNGRNPPR